MTKDYITVKRIDNSRLVRAANPNRVRDSMRIVAYSAVLAAGFMLFAWQHFQCLQLGYQLEELKAERAQASEMNERLKLEVAALKSPERIDAIARGTLGLTMPVPGQVATAYGPPEAVLAQARQDVGGQARANAASSTSTR
jgi:cell division protein FtsL